MGQNEKGESIPTRLTTGWKVCIDYRKLNVITRIIFLFYSWTKYWRGFWDILIIVFLMATLVIFKLRLPWKIKRRSREEDAIWFMQCSRHFSNMHAKHL